MQIIKQHYPLPVSHALLELLQNQIEKSEIKKGECVVIHFRDPTYSKEQGGFHPVEMALNRSGQLIYITDFAYVGVEPFIELAKELDFDFQFGRFQQCDHDHDIRRGVSIFKLWQRNFLAYYSMGVYDITAEAL